MIAFDLDDTLYTERTYVMSGYAHVARMLLRAYPMLDAASVLTDAAEAEPAVFDRLADRICVFAPGFDRRHLIDQMVEAYRLHFPDITLPDDVRSLLDRLKASGHRLGIITDGHAIAQRNKIEALGLNALVDARAIIVSEEVGADKNTPVPFQTLMSRYPDEQQWIYVGDNPQKDFHYPRLMGWTTVMLRDAGISMGEAQRNIHTQALPEDADFHPHFQIDHISQLLDIIN